MSTRLDKLRRNFSLMFWIQALTSIQVINAISTLFMTHRGLSLADIYYTAIAYSLVSLIFEVPSSYLADKWGRKNVVILSCVAYLLYWVATIFAHSFALFALAIGIYGCSNALLSGTDEALIYDTSKELNREDHSLKQLGKYFSAQRIFKIFVPLVAVLIAKNLADSQFITLLLIDVVASIAAIYLSTRLEEPRHFFSLEAIEAGIFKDALKLFRQNQSLLTIMLSRTLLFIAAFMMWRVNSDFFFTMGVPVIAIGILTTSYQSLQFLGNWNIEKILPHLPISQRINLLNRLATIAMTVFFANHLLLQNKWIYLITFMFLLTFEAVRWPLFSQILNGFSQSYNRATVLSLASVLKSVLDIPLLLLSALLISQSYTYLFGLIILVTLIATFGFSLHHRNH